MMLGKIRVFGVWAMGLALLSGTAQAITIGQGPAVGTDKKGVTYYEEFQDWTSADLLALDQNDDQYKWDHYADTGRDMIAFYWRDDGTNLYFRVDFFDLGYGWEQWQGAEPGQVDVYLGIDCVSNSGQPWFPDETDFQTDHPWEACVAVYDSQYSNLYAEDWSTHPSDYLGSYWHSDLDAVEFGIKRSFLTSRGWDGNPGSIHFIPVTVRDFPAYGNQGDILNEADAVDCFGTLQRSGGSPTTTGIIYGAIPGDSTTSRAKYAVIAHANQSVAAKSGTQKHLFTNYSADLKPGFVRLLDTAEMFDLPLNLHISGSLLMSFMWATQNPSDPDYPTRDGPTFVNRVRDYVTTGPGSLIGGVLAEHIMPYFEGEVNEKSIDQRARLMEHLFGVTPQDMKVMHTPERVIRSQTNHPHVSASGPLDGKTFEEIEASGYTATYLDEITHLHWWFYPNEQNNPGWDDNNWGRWAGGLGNDEEPYHHKIHKINGVYCFMINDREDQSKFGNDDGGMMKDTRYTLLQKALHPDSAQITIVFDDWEAYAGNSFASATPNGNADQIHRTLRWAANHPWIELVNLRDVATWAESDTNWVVDHGYVYDKSSQTYEWLKRASEHTYDNWYYGTAQEESFFDRVPLVHDLWSPSGMKTYGDMNTPGTLIRDSWDTIQQIGRTNLKELAEWSYSAMIYETAWHDEDANPDAYQSRNYQTTFNRDYPADGPLDAYEDTTWDPLSGWAVRLHGHVRAMGVMKEASDWVDRIQSGAQGSATSVYAKDIDDDTLAEYILCNNRVFLVFEAWGARLVRAFVYDPMLNGGDARMVVGVTVSNPPEESENEGVNNNRCSAFKEHYAAGADTHAYADMDYALHGAPGPVAGYDSWTFVSQDGKIRKKVTLPGGALSVRADYAVASDLGEMYIRNGIGPNQFDLMLNGESNLERRMSAAHRYRGLRNTAGGEVYVVAGTRSLFVDGALANAGWNNRELAMTEQVEVKNTATNFTLWLAFSEAAAMDPDGDGLTTEAELLAGTSMDGWDTDGDGISDGYELAHGLMATNAADRNQDLDLDGLSNYEEYLAGTMANRATSVVEVAFADMMPGRAMIRHEVQSGRTYRVQYADGLGAPWRNFAASNVPAGLYHHLQAPGWHTFTDDYTAASSGSAPTGAVRAYRIQVSPTP